MSRIIRGTTPTITFTITSDVDLTKFTEIWFTIADSKTTAERTYKLSESEVAVDSEAKTITVHLSQEDTLKLRSSVRVQIRALNDEGNSFATNIIDVALEDILKGGVITDE